MNKITRNTEGVDFDDIVRDFQEFSHYEHRKGSTFFVKAIYEISEEFDPSLDRSLDGYWESNEFIYSEIDNEIDGIYELNRVEKRERTEIIVKWEKVED